MKHYIGGKKVDQTAFLYTDINGNQVRIGDIVYYKPFSERHNGDRLVGKVLSLRRGMLEVITLASHDAELFVIGQTEHATSKDWVLKT